MEWGINVRCRGAVFTLDLIAAMFFFLTIILCMLWVWGESHSRMETYRDMRARQTRLLDVSTMLVKTQGNPYNWYVGVVDPDSILGVGLVSEENVLDPARLEGLEAVDYQRLREIMGFGDEDFHMTVSENWSGTPVVLYEKGERKNASEKMVVRRYALHNGTRVELKLEAYYNRKI